MALTANNTIPPGQFRPFTAGAVNLTGLNTVNQTPVALPPPNQSITNQVANTIRQTAQPFGSPPIQQLDAQGSPIASGAQLPVQPITGAARDFSQFGDVNTQNAIRAITNELGFPNAANVINGVIVDSNGNPIAGAPSEAEFNNLLQQRLNPTQPNVIASNPGGTVLTPEGVNLQLQGQVAPPTGLIGSEQALQGGLEGALGAIGTGAEQGRTDLIAGQQGAQQQLDAAQANLAGNALNIFDIATTQIDERFGVPGSQANQRQAALSGALGPEAQAAAFQSFTDSPGQQFLRDQQEQALLRNAGATGGLGGGRVLEALQRQAAGNAAQNFQQSFQNLGTVAERGLTADQVRSGLAGQIGGQFLGQQGAIDLAGANLTSGTGSQLANQALQAGFGAGNLISGTGTQVSQGRLDTGRQIADSISNTTSGLSALAEALGAGLSSTIGTQGGNLAGVITNLSNQLGVSEEQLGVLLSNISVGQGTTVAGQPSTAQFIPQGTNVELVGNLLTGAGNVAQAFSDADT